jgi:tetratricopeptide (TPR) repeat protein
MGREREAEKHFEAALELRPGLYGAHQALARVSWKRGDRAVAIAHYEAMIAIAAENPAGHFLMGRALQTGGHLRRALAYYRSALAIDPDHEGARKAVERIEDSLAGSSAGIPRVERASPP